MQKTMLECVTKLIAILLLLLPVGAYGAPAIQSVSGTYSTGSTVTIVSTGSSFGTKSPAAPVLWAPFDTGISPSSLGRVTTWQENNCIDYVSSGGWAGGAAKTRDSCSKSSSGTAELGITTSGIGYFFNTLGQKSYIYRHRKMGYTDDTNLKSLEIMVTGNYTSGNNIVFNHSSGQWITQNISPASYCYMNQSPAENQWVTEELITQTASSGGANAFLEWWANGSLIRSSGQGCQVSWRGSGGTNMDNIKPAFHGDYNTSGGTLATATERWDDLYVDSTWARVILGNASTLAASTHREIQIPTSWSASSITISFNQGTFLGGTTAYLFVIDSNNAASGGTQITIGGGGGGVPPRVPSPTTNIIVY